MLALSTFPNVARIKSLRNATLRLKFVASRTLSYMARCQGDEVSAESILQATERIRPHVHKTPFLTSRFADAITGRKLYFKCEMFQKTGSFKFRGVSNCILRMKEERSSDYFQIVTHSSGNHGQAVARAAQFHNIKATVVVPSIAPTAKKNAILNYGATLIECEPSAQVREDTVMETLKTLGDEGEFIPSADHALMMDGAGSAAIEMLEEVPCLDAVVVCCGTGGFIGGVSQYCKEVNPNMHVFAAEPLLADDTARSFQKGERIEQTDYPSTIADGLRMPVGKYTWPVLQRNITSVITVTDDEIVKAMYFLWERTKILAEPSGAVAFAAVLSDQFKTLPPSIQHVGITLSGGNMDLSKIPWMLYKDKYDFSQFNRI